MRERAVWFLKWGGLAIVIGAALAMLAARVNHDPVAPWVLPLAVGAVMLGVGWYAEERPGEPRRRAHVRGYVSHVVDARESPVYRGHNVIDLRLYTPDGKPIARPVSCRVTCSALGWNSKLPFPRWQSRILEESDREHYHLFLMRPCFEDVPDKLGDVSTELSGPSLTDSERDN